MRNFIDYYERDQISELPIHVSEEQSYTNTRLMFAQNLRTN